MDGYSRREMLRVAGVLGAAGTVGLAGSTLGTAIAGATPRTTIGTGSGPDPLQVFDDEADPLMKAVLERGDAGRINAALANWTTNGQPVPKDVPSDVRDFIEHARTLPSWYSPELMRDANEFYRTRSMYLSVIIGFSGGVMMSVIPREARAVYWSAGGANMKDRIAKTYRLVYDSIAVDAYGPNGKMAVTAVKTRMTHGAVRHLLPQSPHWKRVATEKRPISQGDMMVTWHSLATMGMRIMANWNIELPRNEMDGLLHSWQLHASMLGVDDAYIPASWAQAETQAQRMLDPIMGPTPEGVKIANMLVNLGRDLDGTVLSRPSLEAFTRYSLGDKLTDWMQLPRQPALQALLEASWPTFIGIREGQIKQNMLPPEAFHLTDEIAKTIELNYLGEFRPVNITIPTGNNPNYR